MTCGVYKITNTVTGEFYIGQSPDIERRWNDHQNFWGRDTATKYGCKKLFESVKRHGVNAFVFEVLEECPRSALLPRETELINTLAPALNGRGGIPDRVIQPVRVTGIFNRIKPFVDAMGKTRYRFWKDTSLAQNTAYGLYDDPTQIPNAYGMHKICSTYDVQPREFLIYIPDRFA